MEKYDKGIIGYKISTLVFCAFDGIITAYSNIFFWRMLNMNINYQWISVVQTIQSDLFLPWFEVT